MRVCWCWIFDISRNYQRIPNERRITDSTAQCVDGDTSTKCEKLRNQRRYGWNRSQITLHTAHFLYQKWNGIKWTKSQLLRNSGDEDGKRRHRPNHTQKKKKKRQIDFWWAFTLLFSYSEYVFAYFSVFFLPRRSFVCVQLLLLVAVETIYSAFLPSIFLSFFSHLHLKFALLCLIFFSFFLRGCQCRCMHHGVDSTAIGFSIFTLQEQSASANSCTPLTECSV